MISLQVKAWKIKCCEWKKNFFCPIVSILYTTAFERKRFGTVCMPYFRIARDPSNLQAALADPYLGQSIGPVPGYGVSFWLSSLHIFFIIIYSIIIIIMSFGNIFYFSYFKILYQSRSNVAVQIFKRKNCLRLMICMLNVVKNN